MVGYGREMYTKLYFEAQPEVAEDFIQSVLHKKHFECHAGRGKVELPESAKNRGKKSNSSCYRLVTINNDKQSLNNVI
jgi:hypothetical protein